MFGADGMPGIGDMLGLFSIGTFMPVIKGPCLSSKDEDRDF